MTNLFSVLVAALALLGGGPGAADATQAAQQAATLQSSRERLELARLRQAKHAQALAHGDLSMSPYFRHRGPVGRTGTRHDEMAWYRELTERA